MYSMLYVQHVVYVENSIHQLCCRITRFGSPENISIHDRSVSSLSPRVSRSHWILWAVHPFGVRGANKMTVPLYSW